MKPENKPHQMAVEKTSKNTPRAVIVSVLLIFLSIGATVYLLLIKPSPTSVKGPTQASESPAKRALVTDDNNNQESNPDSEKNNSGLVSFIKNDTRNWPMEWHLILSPEDIKANEFRIISQLKSPKPTNIENAIGFEDNILLAVLVNEREIQPETGDPVNIKFRLGNETYQNPNGPRGYQYSDLSASFSRLGGTKIDESTSTPVLPYGTSFPIFLLGDTIVSKNFVEAGDFINSRILLATISTSGENNYYIYEIILEKFPIK